MEKNLDFFKIEHNNVLPEKGKVLVSEPFLQDAYFKRSVILLTEHNEEGSLGFVLNNPIEFGAEEILKDFPSTNSLVGIGGPVRTDTVHYLHRKGDLIPESVHVIDDLFWGGDFESVKIAIETGELPGKDIRFFVGFSSWHPGQLDREISENSWLVTELDCDSVMRGIGNELWEKVLMKEDRKYQMWTHYPEDPLLN
ncbi:MAG: YqgE/AlgH family protein [Bacteroidota bacterium]|nr:YqgE/AlgH family protein [Bacteroidota bacterium]